MKSYRKAKEETEKRAWTTVLMTLWDGWENRNFTGMFLKKRIAENAKTIIKNDKEAIPDLLTVLLH